MAAVYIAFFNYQKAITASYKEVVNNLSSIKNLGQMYKYKKQQTQTLEGAVNIAQDLCLAGYANYLEVIRSQESALIAELELIDTKIRIYRFRVDLYRSLGGGWK